MSERFESFKGAVGREGGRRKWFRSTGAVPLVLAGLVFAGVGALLVFLAQDGWRSVYPRYSDVLLVGAGAGHPDLLTPGAGAVMAGLWLVVVGLGLALGRSTIAR